MNTGPHPASSRAAGRSAAGTGLALHLRPKPGRGFTPVVQAGRELQHLSFGFLRLAAGEGHRLGSPGEELAIVLLSGSFRLSGAGFEADPVGPRPGVFGGRASAVFLPPGAQIQVQALEPLEAAVIGSPTTGQATQAVLVTPQQVRVEARGKPGFRRQVHWIVDERVAARRLLVGETLNRPGEWSSYPPHKHDEWISGVEAPLEELYYFRIDPPGGFGIQLVYSPGRGVEESYRVLDGDVVLIPFGYHPVVAAPGYRLYYLWALAGEGRALRFREDPAHAWVNEVG